MSFSSKVKREICRLETNEKEEVLAELSAIMKGCGTVGMSGDTGINFQISTENPAIARRIFKLLKEMFNVNSKLLVKRSNSLKKNNLYVVQINKGENVIEILDRVKVLDSDTGYLNIDYNIPKEIIKNDSCKKAYIRGAFLGSGSISNPERAYHVEFVAHDLDYANNLSKLINSYKIKSKVIGRKNSYIIYIKEGEQIVDILSIIGAYSALLEFENIRIMKELRNNVNRIVNCETANLSKTVNASVRQIESIKLIQKEIGLTRLPQNLRDVAEIRLSYPNESLKELGEMMSPPIGKSGINHRLRKVEKIAGELRREVKR